MIFYVLFGHMKENKNLNFIIHIFVFQLSKSNLLGDMLVQPYEAPFQKGKQIFISHWVHLLSRISGSSEVSTNLGG